MPLKPLLIKLSTALGTASPGATLASSAHATMPSPSTRKQSALLGAVSAALVLAAAADQPALPLPKRQVLARVDAACSSVILVLAAQQPFPPEEILTSIAEDGPFCSLAVPSSAASDFSHYSSVLATWWFASSSQILQSLSSFCPATIVSSLSRGYGCLVAPTTSTGANAPSTAPAAPGSTGAGVVTTTAGGNSSPTTGAGGGDGSGASSSGLSQGAKIGIGVGVTFGLLVLALLIYLAWLFRRILKKNRMPVEPPPEVAGPRELDNKDVAVAGAAVPSNHGMASTNVSVTPARNATTTVAPSRPPYAPPAFIPTELPYSPQVVAANELPYSPHATEIDSHPPTRLYELSAGSAPGYVSPVPLTVSGMGGDTPSVISQSTLVDPPGAEYSQVDAEGPQSAEALRAKHAQLEARRRTLLELQQIEEEQQAIQERLAGTGPSH